MKVLLTAFEPFAAARTNPSEEVVRAYHGARPGIVLPNSIRRMPEVLRRALAREKPDVVLHLGESRYSPGIIVERGAQNVLDMEVPDNDGVAVRHKQVVAGAPKYMKATVPVLTIEKAIRAAGIPVKTRADGGTYVSNQLFYLTLRAGYAAGFLHIPPVRGRAGSAGMPLWRLVKATEVAIAAIEGKKRLSSKKGTPLT